MSERHFTVAEASTKQHAELVSSSNHQYCVHMGGTRDGFNTADYIETYGGATRYTPGFEPNRSVTIEIRGTSETRNPRLVVNNRRSWFSVEHILRSVISPGMSDFETVMAIFRFSSDIFLQAHDNDRRPGPLYPNEATNPSTMTIRRSAKKGIAWHKPKMDAGLASCELREVMLASCTSGIPTAVRNSFK